MTLRADQRAPNQLREIAFTPDYQLHPAGSVLVACGRTRVICAVTTVDGVPRWMRDQRVPGGWLTAEYQMLPGATGRRKQRPSSASRADGRNLEIQRLVGRSLRAVMDLERLPAKTLHVDCDVLDADGGTRCAAVTGAAVALEIALKRLFGAGEINDWPLRERVAAVSAGVVDGQVLLDLAYAEDVAAEVDMNIVMTASGRFVEIQGTAEIAPFERAQMDGMLDLATQGLTEIFALQKQVVEAHAQP